MSKPLPTRDDMMSNKVTFEEYYTSVAKVAHIDFEYSGYMPDIRDALAKGDYHLNNIPLEMWAQMALMVKAAIKKSLERHSDFYSTAGAVCTLKQAARNAAGQTTTVSTPQ